MLAVQSVCIILIFVMNVPSKLVLTCTVSGKTVTWTNKSIIAKKIAEHGSLDAFIKQFTCRGANKAAPSVRPVGILKPILERGVAIGNMTLQEYQEKFLTKTN